MPRYDYYCDICNEKFELCHSLKDKIVECPKCKNSGSFQKLYDSEFHYDTKQALKNKPGDEVKRYIKNAKEELREFKRDLKPKDA